jgi:hypothetical protein
MKQLAQQKIAYSIALLAAAIASRTILELYGSSSIGQTWPVSLLKLDHVYFAFTTSLSLCVYFYALAFVSSRISYQLTYVGDVAYAFTMLTPIFWISAFFLDIVFRLIILFGLDEFISVISTVGTLLVGALIGGAGVLVFFQLRRRQGESFITGLSEYLSGFVVKATQQLSRGFFNAVALEARTTLELSLKSALDERGVGHAAVLTNLHNLIRVVQRLNLVDDDWVERANRLRILANNSIHGPEKITAQQAANMIDDVQILVRRLAEGDEA